MTYSPLRHIGSVFWKHNPIQLTFFLTRRCNQRCSFCFYPVRKKSPPFRLGESDKSDGQDKKYSELSNGVYLSSEAERDAAELAFNEIEKISSSIGRLLWLAFSGGEIFLRNDLVEITKVFYKKNKPAIILFPTNGLLTDIIKRKIEEILKHCRKSTIVIKLSLDGTEDVNDSIRGAKGSFQKTMLTYTALEELLQKYPNFELGINTVFCSLNQANMDELIEFVNKLENIKTHTVSLIRGDVLDEKLKDIDIGKYHETIKNLESNLKKRISSTYRFRGARLKAAQDILQRRLIYKTMVQDRQLIPCYAGRLNLVLTETGDLYPCESFTMKMGNVRDNGYDIKKMLKSTQAKKVTNSIKNNGCYCTHECYFMTNILFNPRTYPALLKEYMQI